MKMVVVAILVIAPKLRGDVQSVVRLKCGLVCGVSILGIQN